MAKLDKLYYLTWAAVCAWVVTTAILTWMTPDRFDAFNVVIGAVIGFSLGVVRGERKLQVVLGEQIAFLRSLRPAWQKMAVDTNLYRLGPGGLKLESGDEPLH